MPQKSIYRVVHFLMIHENQHTPYNLIQFYFLTQTVSLFLSLSKTCHLGLTVKLFIYHSLLHCLPLVSPSMLPQTSPHTKQSYSLKDLCPTYNNNNSVFTSCRAFNIFFFTIIKSIILLHLRSLFWLTYVYLWMLLWQKKMFATLRFQSTQKKPPFSSHCHSYQHTKTISPTISHPIGSFFEQFGKQQIGSLNPHSGH